MCGVGGGGCGGVFVVVVVGGGGDEKLKYKARKHCEEKPQYEEKP